MTSTLRKSTGRAVMLDLNLPQLQNLIKRDPQSYREDYLRQWRHYQSNLEILKWNPAQPVPNFAESILFLAHVSHCYPEQVAEFAPQWMDLLRNHFAILQPDLRKTLVQALILLRSKKQLDQIQLLSLLFFLFRCRDKQLRASLHTFIVTDIKAANQKCKNNKLNKVLQNFMYGMITGTANGSVVDASAAGSSTGQTGTTTVTSSGDASDIAAQYSLQICMELYRKNIWNDSKTVNILAEGLFSPFPKVLVAALKFFLGVDRDTSKEEDSDDEEAPDLHQLQYRNQITKKSKSQQARMYRAMKVLKRKEKKQSRAEAYNFSALHILNDPQGLAEKLFSRLVKTTSTASGGSGVVTSNRELKFEVRLMMFNLISRIIGLHKLILLNFYPNIVRFLKPHQQDVTQILAICAQATHDLVPPDAIETVVRSILDNFVTDSYASEVITVGVNAIREICARCPLAMDAESLGYLVTFKSHRDKGVMIAVKSLIALFREIHPELLPKKERGKVATMEISAGDRKMLAYGKQTVAEGVAGAEFLGSRKANEDDDAAWQVQEGSEVEVEMEEEVEVDEGSDSGWVTMSQGKGDQMVEDGEEDIEADEAWEEGGSSEELEEMSGDEEIEDEDYEEEDQEEREHDASENVPQLVPAVAPAQPSASRIETSRILTPADFALMKQLRQRAEAEKMVNGPQGKRKRALAEASAMESISAVAGNDEDSDDSEAAANRANNVIDTGTIFGPRKKAKQNREERIAAIEEGRKGREKFGSRRGKERASVTNKEKSKKKNFMMMVHKRSVVAKKKMSLRDKQIKLRQHVDRQKKQNH